MLKCTHHEHNSPFHHGEGVLPLSPNAHHSSRPLLAAFQESLVREIDEQATTSRRAMLRAAAAAKTQAYKQRRASSEQQSYEDLITTLDRQCREGLFR